MGGIIGKQGSKIKEIRENTGAHIKVGAVQYTGVYILSEAVHTDHRLIILKIGIKKNKKNM